MYLAHLDDIATRTEQRVSYEELLTLWDAIPATGSENLYERLFLYRWDAGTGSRIRPSTRALPGRLQRADRCAYRWYYASFTDVA